HRRLAPRGLGCTPPPSASSERAPRHGPPPVGVAIKPGRRFDATFITFRLLASVPNTVFETLQYLRLSQLFPFALVHALMDGASALIGANAGILPPTDLTDAVNRGRSTCDSEHETNGTRSFRSRSSTSMHPTPIAPP